MPLALTEDQIEYLCIFRTSRVKAISSAAKSLINYFRDVCPELLPKKMRGRFTEIDEDNAKSAMVFGQEKVNFDIDGIELLKKAEKLDDDVNLGADRVLDNDDLKKIRILQLKEGVRRVDRHGFRDDGVEEAEKMQEESHRHAIRDEYFHKMQELLRLKRGLPPAGMKGEEYDDEDMDDEEGEAEHWEDEEGEI